tara:strand:+ start:7112 stop:8893 length:1782 start_codon:yes stop_codon:yes gene_type:complete
MAKKNINFNTYVKRDLDKTTVNWGSVASNLTTDLLRIRKEREAKRAEIDANTSEVESKLNEMEDYTNQSLQNLALDMSGNSANFLRTQNDLFKRGLITQTEFAQAKQRVLGDWKQFGNVSKRWESDYTEMVKRAENKDASSFEIWFNEQNAEFGNLKNVKGYVNPDSGRLSLVRPNEDGSISMDPSRHVSMNVIQNRFNTRINNVTKNGAIDKQLEGSVDRLGELILADIDKSGNILSIEGQKQALETDLIQEYLDNTVGTLTDDDNTVFSILGDMGQGYKPEFDPKKAALDPKLVLVEYNELGMPVPVKDAPFWESQVEEANELLKNRMIAMLDNKEAVKAGDKDLTEYQRQRLALERERLKKLEENENELIEEDFEAMKYRPNIYSVQEGKLDNKNAKAYLNAELGTDIQQLFGIDSDKELKKVFNKVALAAIDPKIIEDLQRGEYGKKFKPYDFYYEDEGADRFTMELGDKKIQYPPLQSQLKYSTDDLGMLNAELKAGGYTGPPMKNGQYAVDSNGDGEIDAVRTGMENLDTSFNDWFFDTSMGISADDFDKNQEILDYMQRYLLEPAVDTLIKEQERKFKSKKKKLPI